VVPRLDRALRIIEALDAGASEERPRSELDARFDELIEACADLSEEERASAREAYTACQSWGTWESWMARTPYLQRFREGRDPRDLKRALAHWALCDGHPDPRDAIVGISEALRLGESYEIDVAAIANEVAALASPLDAGFGSLRSCFAPLLRAPR
jgi:hypothetical protein